MPRTRSIALAFTGLAAAVLAALALAAPAGAGDSPFILKVAKDKDGPYAEGFTDVKLQDGQVKDFFFRVRNREPDPFNDMRFTEEFGPPPKGLILRWFRGDENITSAVQGTGHVFNLPSDGRRYFKLVAKAQAGDLGHCLGAEADFQNTISDFAYLQLNKNCP